MQNINNIITEITKQYGTPVYIYFEEIIHKRIKDIFHIFKHIDFSPTFAVKANGNPAILKIIASHGFGMDVVTPGELKASLLAGVKAENIIWNGCGKSAEDMKFFLSHKIGTVNIDSLEELELWAQVIKDSSHMPEFFVRFNPEVRVLTHHYISTGLKKHKFGVPLNLLGRFFEKAGQYSIKISGLHSHIGSQITDVNPFYQAFNEIFSIAREKNIIKVNIGGGFGINYSGKGLDIVKYRKQMFPLLQDFQISSEYGRFIIAEAGWYVVRVNTVKWNGHKHFIVADGGMNHLLRPALYDAIHNFDIIGNVNKENEFEYNIVGPLCESGDILYLNWNGYLPERDSLIAFKNAGAYGYAMANNYNSSLKPPEVLVTKHNEIKLIRRRETFEDMFGGVIL